MSETDLLRPLETTWEDWVLGGSVVAAFADPSLPLEVEIGPGDDDFLLEAAVADPRRNWLGIEYSRKRVRRYVRRVESHAGALGNLRLAWRPAADVVGPFLVPGKVHAYHVYFPDPWPKKHHHRYRMLSPEFLEDLRQSLVPGGEVRVCTDHREYAEEMLGAVGAAPGWRTLVPDPGWRPLAPGELGTVFEERWRAEGRTLLRLGFARA
jgi:tRNA (guanine-N7-)-methyltransferase